MIHGVYFYEDDTFLIDHVAGFAKEGLERQETVIIVATEQHRGDFKTKLTEDLVGLWAATTGNYVTLDASTTLGLFMRNGWPDEELFLKVIGQIIQSAEGSKPVRIYGEMVAVLWAEGNALAAIHLERLWNKLAAQRNLTLLCGYPSSAFHGADMDFAFEDVCACHSQIKGFRSSARV
ncbi:MAG TPA: MEDS domain-containing protein [Candidatus Saccharimonadales bacterium]|nr:MEDS domain-containing protein [Candidatus Saccharimonadales bacterium]